MMKFPIGLLESTASQVSRQEFILQKCSKENVLSVVFLFGLPHSGWNAVLLLTNNPQPIISRDYRGERVDWAGGIYIIMYTL